MSADATKPHTDGSLNVAISNAVVSLVRQYAGRGPTKARTTVRENVVLVMLEQNLTSAEHSLIAHGRDDTVIQMRRAFQDAMRDESSEKVAELTGRHVTAMMSANHLVPDLAAEIYVLDGPPNRPCPGEQPV